MAIFDSITGKPAQEATALNIQRLGDLERRGMRYLDQGKKGALGSFDQAAGVYKPLQTKYGAGTDLYLDSLGVNGAEGNQRAVGSFQAGPGYEFGMNQSLDALDRRAASRGMLASGNNTIDTLSTVTGLANQEYGNWQNRLAGLISPEMQAAGGVAGAYTGQAGVHQNDAMNRVNLASNVAGGMNSATTQGANAQMQGSANALGLGLNLAKLGTAFLGGGGLGGAAGGAGGVSAYMQGGTPVPMFG